MKRAHGQGRIDLRTDRTKRCKRAFTLAYMDADTFKVVNDTFGHSTGVRLLQSVVEVLASTLRKSDVVADVGGEELALPSPECGAQEAHSVVDKTRSKLSEKMQENGRRVTFSIGALTCRENNPNSDEMMRRVDGLVYAAKTRGKSEVRHSADCRSGRDPPASLGQSWLTARVAATAYCIGHIEKLEITLRCPARFSYAVASQVTVL